MSKTTKETCKDKPPAFRELGNIAGNIFEKEYYSGRCRVSVRTKTCSDIDFHLEGEKNRYSGVTLASLQTRLNYPDLGLTFVKRWSTNSTFFGKVIATSFFAKGLDATAEINFNPYNGEKSGVVKASYQQDYINALLECVSGARENRKINVSAVGRLCEFAAGVQLKYDQPNRQLLNAAFAGGYVTPKFALSSMVESSSRFTTSMFQKVGDNVETGFVIKYDSVQNISYAAFGATWQRGRGLMIRGKMDTMCNVGVSVSRYFRPEMLATFTFVTNIQHFSAASSEIGFAIEFRG